jgi:ABC-type multidrug transport system fused ATPase/permease subunit
MNTTKTEPIPKFSWWDLIKAFYYLLDNKRKGYLFYTFVLILVLFYDLAPTYLIGRVVDFFSNYTAGEPLNGFYNLVLILSISWGAVSLIRLSIKKRLSIIRADTTYSTKTKGFEKLLDFSLNWHDKENTGNKIEKIKNGVESLKQMQNTLSNEFFAYSTTIIGVLISFIFIKPILFFYSLAYIIVFLIVQLSFYNKMVEMNNTNNALQEKAGGSYYEGLGNILTIKTMGVKDDFKKNIVSKEAYTRDHSIEMVHVGNNKWKAFQIVNALALGGILYFTGQSFIANLISLGSIFIIYNYFQKLSGAISQSTNLFEGLIKIRSSIARMMPIFWDGTKSEGREKIFPAEWDNITLENANFKYKNNSQDKEEASISESGLQNINLKIDKFSKVGLVGKSGSGKSTIAKILIGLYEIESGSYKIGIDNFYQIKHDEITKQIALVLQDSEMFNLSLKENITLMRPFDANLFEKAISISQLKPVMEKLPEGIETLIGEKGYRLSGGERQRIGIARAIYKDPQILILDEATSSLDSNTETLIQKAFEENLEKKTVISIAHRISTLKNVNKIFVFEHGQIVEEGSFQELSQNKDSKFYEIYQGQSEREN